MEPKSDQPKTSRLSIASFILGILGVPLFGLISIPTIICGHLALKHLKKTEASKGKGFAITGLILGYLMLFFILASWVGPTNVIGHAEKINSQNTASNLKASIAAYYTEYRKYPIIEGRKENEELRSNHEIMDILLGSGVTAKKGELNPRMIVFFAGRTASPMKGGKFRKGVKLDPKGGGELWDPWGNHYYILLDLNDDGQIGTPKWDKKLGSKTIPESILIWSAGKDGILGTKDDIKTW